MISCMRSRSSWVFWLVGRRDVGVGADKVTSPHALTGQKIPTRQRIKPHAWLQSCIKGHWWKLDLHFLEVLQYWHNINYIYTHLYNQTWYPYTQLGRNKSAHLISRTQQVMKLLSEIKRLQRVARCMTLSYQCFTCEVFDFAHRGSCFKVWNAVRYILYFWIQLESYSDIWLLSEAIISREPHQISSQMDMARAMVKWSLADEFRIDRRQEARQAQPERSRSHSWNHPCLAIDSSQFWTCMHIKKQSGYRKQIKKRGHGKMKGCHRLFKKNPMKRKTKLVGNFSSKRNAWFELQHFIANWSFYIFCRRTLDPKVPTC